MTRRTGSVVLTAVLAVTGWQQRAALAAPPAGYALTFADEFNGTALDLSAWRVLPERPNVEVANGVVDLITTEVSPGVYSEGWIDTSVFKQRYGYYESRFRIGNKTGLNNAFWLNTPDEWVSGNDHDRMEVDINEAHFPSSQSSDFAATLHDWDTGANLILGSSRIDVGDLSTTFHTFGLEWRTDNTMVFSLDGVARYTLAGSAVEGAFNTIPLEVILSTKVLPGNFAGPLDPNIVGTRMSVDYVRVYDKPGFTGALSSNWGSNENWGDGDWNRVGEAALFNRPTVQSVVEVAGTNKQAREVLFDNDVPALTFIPRADFPAATLNLGLNETGAITINEDVTATQTFNIPIIAEGNLTLSNFARAANVDLVINKAITGSGVNRELTVFTTNDVIISGSIASSIAAVQKYQSGTAYLAGANEHTGQTLIKQGTLVISSATALGSATTNTVVSNNATLGLAGGFTYARAEAVQIAGDGSGERTGAIELMDGSNVSIETMPITLSSNAVISSALAAGRLRLGAITVDAGRTLTFTGSGRTDLAAPISGTGTIVKSGTGRLALLPTATFSGALRLTAGTVELLGNPGTASLVVTAGTAEIRTGSAGAVRLGSTLHVTAGQIDLLDSALILSKTAGNTVTTVQSLVTSGYATGTWTGSGIVTSLAGPSLIIGFADNAQLGLTTFNGATVTSDSLLVRATRPGDTNLDGITNLTDLLVIYDHYNESNATWVFGDSNYDGVVNFVDLRELALNYDYGAGIPVVPGATEAFNADLRLAFVPEPASLTIIALFPMIVRRPRG